ncbi:hypothetical protein L9F63_016175 [Diploptera punctata]|uniref:Uncharacterized protein n=1 Tax=Diploptera punctata TaxID=6984 RepID=A0AAD8EI60_DIPPU|nr:hypothetical protein L9F63_016175 [Diploptera punctata]
MISTLLHLTLFSVLILYLKVSPVSAKVDEETLSNTVVEHTNILKEFPVHVQNVKALENKLEDFQPRLTVIEAHTANLQSDMKELTDVSIAYTKSLNKLDNDVTKLSQTVKTYKGSLNDLEIYKRKTNKLENETININDELQNNSIARNNISEKFQILQKTCLAVYKNISSDVEKINSLKEEQKEISIKLDDFVHDLGVEKNFTSQNLNILQQKCIAEQQNIKTEVQNLDTIVDIQANTKNKLQNLIVDIENEKNNNQQSLESLQNNINTTQSQVRTELQKIVPLSKSQEETMKKLDDLINLLNQLKNEQITIEKKL